MISFASPTHRIIKSSAPGLDEVHVNRPLTDIMHAYKQSKDNFVARSVFPVLPVQHRSDFYTSLPKGQGFRSIAAKRADGTETPGRIHHIKNDNTYLCSVYGVHQDVGRQTLANADAAINLEAQIVEYLTQDLLIRQEQDWVNAFFRKGVWSGLVKANGVITDADHSDLTYTGGPWDTANSTPIEDTDFFKLFMHSRTGEMPNTWVVTPDIFNVVKNHPQVIERYKFSGNLVNGRVTEQMIADVFGFDRVIIAKAVVNAAEEGQEDKMGLLLRNGYLMCYTAPNPGLMTPSCGYTMDWINYFSGGQAGAVSEIPVPLKKAVRYEAELAYDMKLIGSDLGIFGTNVLSKPSATVIL